MSNLTKEDYMKLSKERLAELLVERDNENAPSHPFYPYYPPFNDGSTGKPPCWSEDGVCTSPYRDCIDCPGKRYKGNWTWTVSTGTSEDLIQPTNGNNGKFPSMFKEDDKKQMND